MLKQYSTLYTADSPKWDNITDLAHSFGWKNLIESTGAEFFTSNGVSKQYVFELIEAASRVNYGQVYFLFVVIHLSFIEIRRILIQSMLSRLLAVSRPTVPPKSRVATGRSLSAF